MLKTLAPVRVAAPATMPVSRDEAKAQCRIDGTAEDTFIDSLIAAATDHFDGWSGVLGRCLVNQTWRIDLACFPGGSKIRLPLAPVGTVTVKYSDASNVEQTFPAGSYEGPFTDAHGPFIALKGNATWPETYVYRRDAVRVSFVVGYGAAAAVPPPLKQAVLLLVGHWFSNREAVVTGTISTEVQLAVDYLILPYRRLGF